MTWPAFLTGLNTIENAYIINPLIGIGLRPFASGINIGSITEPFQSVHSISIYNHHGLMRVNEISADAPLHATIDAGTCSISLDYDPSTLEIVDGKLTAINYSFQNPISVAGTDTSKTVSLQHDDSLTLNEAGELSVLFPAAAEVTDLSASEPILVEKSSGLARITLLTDESLHTTDGQLGVNFPPAAEVSDLSASEPILVEKSSGLASISLSHDASLQTNASGELSVNFPPLPEHEFPLVEAEGTVRLAVDPASLKVTEGLGLAAIETVFKEPLLKEPDGVGLEISAPLALSEPPEGSPASLTVQTAHPLNLNQAGELAILHDQTLIVDPTTGLGVDYEAPLGISPGGQLGLRCTAPMALTPQGELGLNLHRSMEIKDGELASNVNNVLKPFGAIKSDTGSGILDMIAGSPLDWLEEAVIPESLEDELGDTEAMFVRLSTSSAFSQKGGKLSLKSSGYGRLPFWNLLYDLGSDAAFNYNETLQELNVKYINLTETPGTLMGSGRAIWKSYLASYYKAKQGGAITIGSEVQHAKEISVDVDGRSIEISSDKLAVKTGQSSQTCLAITDSGLAVAKDGLIDNNTLKIANDKIAVDVTKLADGTTIKAVNGTLKSPLNFTTGFKKTGDNIEVALVGDEDIAYSAGMLSCNITGDGITIVKAGPVLRANYIPGPGITISGNIISAISPIKTSKDTDSETSPADTLKTNTTSGSVVTALGPLPLIVSVLAPAISIPFFPIPPIPPTPPFCPPGPPGTVTVPTPPVLSTVVSEVAAAAAAGTDLLGWVSVWGFPPVFLKKREKDEAGNDVLDEFGEPVYEKDPLGDAIVDHDENGYPLFESPPQNFVVSIIDGCLRMRRDKPTCWLGIENEDSREIVSLEMLKEYHDEYASPRFIGLIPELVEPMLAPVSASVDALEEALVNYAELNYVNTKLTTIDYNALLGRPSLGSLAGKSAVDLGTADVTGVLPLAKVDPLLASKSYVDGLTYLTAGTGLTKTGGTLSVNPVQTQITQVGTLQNLAMTGILSMTGTTSGYVVTSYQSGLTTNGFVGMQMGASSGARNNLSLGYVHNTSGSTSNYGFFGCGGASKLKVNGSGEVVIESASASCLQAAGGATFAANVVSATAPTLGTHLTNKGYVDGLTYLTAGTGLTKTNGTLSVNAAQPGITSLGFLTDLSSGSHTVRVPDTNANWGGSWMNVYQLSGQTRWHTALTNAETLNTGSDWALWAHADNGNIWYKALEVVRYNGGLSVYGPVTAAAPTAANHLTTKQYVDDQTVTAGAGLTKTGNALTVNAAQPGITSVGTLTGLTMTGGLTISWAGGISIYGGYVENKIIGTSYSGTDYLDIYVPGSYSGYGASNATVRMSIRGGTGDVSIKSTTATALQVAGGATADRLFCSNGVKLRSNTGVAYDYTIAYNNSGDSLHVHLAGAHDATTHRAYQFGYYTNDVLGEWNSKVSIDTFTGTVSTSAVPTLGDHLANKTYVDSKFAAAEIVLAGTGLTKTGSTLSVNAAQTQITAVGTLTALMVGGTGLFKTSSGPTDYTIVGTKTADDSANTKIVVSGNTRGTTPGCVQHYATGANGYHEFLTNGSRHTMLTPTFTIGYRDHEIDRTVDGAALFRVRNRSNTANAYSILAALNNTEGACTLFLNSSSRTAEGGGNTATLRNDVGNLRLMSNSMAAITLAGQNCYLDGEVYLQSNRFVRLTGNGGIYWTTHQGGWHMTDNQWLRSYSNKGVYTAGEMQADSGVRGNGYFCKAGINGEGSLNRYNFYWSGSTCVLWVDSTFIGVVSTSSSRKLKKDIKALGRDALGLVSRLNPVTFRWKEEGIYKDKVENVGFIAEEVQEVCPQCVDVIDTPQEDGTQGEPSLGLNAIALISVLTKAVQQLTAKVDSLEKKMK